MQSWMQAAQQKDRSKTGTDNDASTQGHLRSLAYLVVDLRPEKDEKHVRGEKQEAWQIQ